MSADFAKENLPYCAPGILKYAYLYLHINSIIHYPFR